jgi:Zn-finger nucleic acid-binding protein
MMFIGAKFCPHCGSAAAQWQSEGGDLQCPGCRNPLLAGTLRDLTLHECGKCYGIWLDTVTFERICREPSPRRPCSARHRRRR